MPTYTVKSAIKHGTLDGKGKPRSKVYHGGSSIELSEAEAYDLRHALKDGPLSPPGVPPLDEEVAASLRNNPENPDSGIEMFWKTQTNAFKRTRGNISQQERDLEPLRQRTLAKSEAVRSKAAQPTVPVRPTVVVPPITRPAPAPPKPVATRPAPATARPAPATTSASKTPPAKK